MKETLGFSVDCGLAGEVNTRLADYCAASNCIACAIHGHSTIPAAREPAYVVYRPSPRQLRRSSP
ncbi:hypothetical protein GCM10010193_33630 [Kitasatospora atroaurantiaca]